MYTHHNGRINYRNNGCCNINIPRLAMYQDHVEWLVVKRTALPIFLYYLINRISDYKLSVKCRTSCIIIIIIMIRQRCVFKTQHLETLTLILNIFHFVAIISGI